MSVSTRAFSKTYSLNDFGENEANMAASGFRVWQTLEVEKGQAERFGRGTAGNQTEAEGRLYVGLSDGTNAVTDGEIRLTVRNKQLELVDIIGQWDLDEVASGETSRGDRYPFPRQHSNYIAYPYVLCLEVSTGADVTLSDAASTVKADGNRLQRVS